MSGKWVPVIMSNYDLGLEVHVPEYRSSSERFVSGGAAGANFFSATSVQDIRTRTFNCLFAINLFSSWPLKFPSPSFFSSLLVGFNCYLVYLLQDFWTQTMMVARGPFGSVDSFLASQPTAPGSIISVPRFFRNFLMQPIFFWQQCTAAVYRCQKISECGQCKKMLCSWSGLLGIVPPFMKQNFLLGI